MKIIDVNASVGYEKKKIQPGMAAEELVRRMDQCGVDVSVAYNTISLRQIQEGNAEMDEIAAASGGRIQSCYMMHPRLDGFQMPKAPELVEYLKKNRPVATRIFPADHVFPLDKLYCGELMEVLQSLRLPLILNNTKAMGDNYAMTIPKIAMDFPELPIVMVVRGFETCMLNYTCLKNTENIILGVSAMCAFGELDNLVQQYGSHRFVMGSTAGCISAGALGMIYMGRFSQEDKENILGGNWLRLQEGIKWES